MANPVEEIIKDWARFNYLMDKKMKGYLEPSEQAAILAEIIALKIKLGINN